MNSSITLKTITLFFLYLTKLSQTYSLQGTLLKDLEGNGGTFDTDAGNWVAADVLGAATSPYTYVCNGQSVLGGYNNLDQTGSFTRTYSSLPAHDIMYIQVTVYILDDWEANEEGINLDIDTVKFNLWNNVGDSPSQWPSNICGSSAKDLGPVTLILKKFHTASTLTLKFYGAFSAPSWQESWGLRDLKITFAYKSPSETEGFCGHVQGGTNMNMGNCDCPDGQYMSGTCQACNTACETCFGGTSKDCYACKTGYISVNNECVLPCANYVYTNNNTCIAGCSSPFTAATVNSINTCNFQCTSSQYLYPDNVCRATCPSPFTIVDEGGAKYCTSPCTGSDFLYWDSTCKASCDYPLTQSTLYTKKTCEFSCTSGQYLLWDRTCSGSCAAPLVTTTIATEKICSTPCNSNEFYYWNQTCISSCETPLQQQVHLSDQFCLYPCSASEYLYWNGTCASSCPLPWSTQVDASGKKFCQYVCDSTQYLYYNGECHTECDTPMTPQINGTIRRCIHPCTDPTNFILSADNSCSNTCDEPLVAKSQVNGLVKLCEAGVTEEQKQQVQTINGAAQTSGAVVSGGLAAISATSSADPGALSVVVLMKMLQYIRYMKVKYPSKLVYLLENQEDSPISFNFGPKIPSSLKAEFQNYTIPENFSAYNVHPSFLVSYWRSITTMAILLLISLIFEGGEVLARKRASMSWNHFFYRLKILIRWNLVILVFCINYDGLVLFSSLQMKTTHFSDISSIISFVIGFFFACIGLYLLYKAFIVIREDRTLMKKVEDMKNTSTKLRYKIFLQKSESFHVLFMGFKKSKPHTHAFFLIFVVRIVLFHLVISYLYEHPLVQACLIVLIGLSMIIYLILFKPFKKLVNLFQMTTYELIILTLNICVLYMAILDYKGDYDNPIKQTLGDVIIYCNVGFSAAALFYMLTKIVLGIKAAYKISKQLKGVEGRRAWLQILVIPFQSGGMGFEEFQIDANRKQKEQINFKGMSVNSEGTKGKGGVAMMQLVKFHQDDLDHMDDKEEIKRRLKSGLTIVGSRKDKELNSLVLNGMDPRKILLNDDTNPSVSQAKSYRSVNASERVLIDTPDTTALFPMSPSNASLLQVTTPINAKTRFLKSRRLSEPENFSSYVDMRNQLSVPQKETSENISSNPSPDRTNNQTQDTVHQPVNLDVIDLNHSKENHPKNDANYSILSDGKQGLSIENQNNRSKSGSGSIEYDLDQDDSIALDIIKDFSSSKAREPRRKFSVQQKSGKLGEKSFVSKLRSKSSKNVFSSGFSENSNNNNNNNNNNSNSNSNGLSIAIPDRRAVKKQKTIIKSMNEEMIKKNISDIGRRSSFSQLASLTNLQQQQQTSSSSNDNSLSLNTSSSQAHLNSQPGSLTNIARSPKNHLIPGSLVGIQEEHEMFEKSPTMVKPQKRTFKKPTTLGGANSQSSAIKLQNILPSLNQIDEQRSPKSSLFDFTQNSHSPQKSNQVLDFNQQTPSNKKSQPYLRGSESIHLDHVNMTSPSNRQSAKQRYDLQQSSEMYEDDISIISSNNNQGGGQKIQIANGVVNLDALQGRILEAEEEETPYLKFKELKIRKEDLSDSDDDD